jgi:archaeosine-15-forming tRNA-guanine transglycosylase
MIYLSDIIKAPFILNEGPALLNFTFTPPSIFNENRKLEYKGFTFELAGTELKPVTGEYLAVTALEPIVDVDGIFTNSVNVKISSYTGEITGVVIEAKLINNTTGESTVVELPIVDGKINFSGLEVKSTYNIKVRVKSDTFTGLWSDEIVVTTPNARISEPVLTLMSGDNTVTGLTAVPLTLSLDISGFEITGADETLKNTIVDISTTDGNIIKTYTLDSGINTIDISGDIDVDTSYVVSAKFVAESFSGDVNTLQFTTMSVTPKATLSVGATTVTENGTIDITITNFNDTFEYRVAGVTVDSTNGSVITIKMPSADSVTTLDVTVYARDVVNGLPESLGTILTFTVQKTPSELDQTFMITGDIAKAMGGIRDGIDVENGISIAKIDIQDHEKTSSTTKIYIDNKLLDLKAGDTLTNGNGELFKVSVVNEEGEIIQEISGKSVACGGYHTFIVDSDGNLLSTGHNSFGQLGLGDTANRNSFVDTGIDDPKSVVCGYDHTLIVDGTGNLLAAGRNNYGQLGLGDTANRDSFTDTGIDNPTAVVCGYYHTLIVDSDGNLLAAGHNSYGQLGLGDTANRNSFVDTGIDNIKSVACGYDHTFIVDSDGNLLAAGHNNYGQLGLGDTANRDSFTDTGIDDPKSVVCGYGYTLIVDGAGKLLGTVLITMVN